MKTLAALILVACLSGCVTTVSQLQTGCESKTKTFPEMTECLKNSIAASQCSLQDKVTFSKKCLNGDANDPLLKLYLLKADQLSDRVQKGEISDLDARVELQRLFVELRNQETMQRAAKASAAAAARAAEAAARPRTTDCYSIGNSISCSSQ